MPDDEQTPPVPRLQEQVIERLQAERIVVLDGELDDKIGTRLCSQLFVLSSDDPRTDISLRINSPGGSVPAMLAIMDTIRLIPNDVSTWRWGWPVAPTSSYSRWGPRASGSPCRTPAS